MPQVRLAGRLPHVLEAVARRLQLVADGFRQDRRPEEAATPGKRPSGPVDLLILVARGACIGCPRGATHKLEARASLAHGAALPAASLEGPLVALDHVQQGAPRVGAGVALVPDKLAAQRVPRRRHVALRRPLRQRPPRGAAQAPDPEASVVAAGEHAAAVRRPIHRPEGADVAPQRGHHHPLPHVRRALLPDPGRAVAAACQDAVAVGGPRCNSRRRPLGHPIHVRLLV
mmetsp:Transcript_9874/g.25752  ORF Transcript_9874/g.25752 Transcript_9874/m.25752 type:complete len:230 (-) Transcript_9874:1100-1789(-)